MIAPQMLLAAVRAAVNGDARDVCVWCDLHRQPWVGLKTISVTETPVCAALPPYTVDARICGEVVADKRVVDENR